MSNPDPMKQNRRAAAQLLKKQKQQEFKSALAVHLEEVRKIKEARRTRPSLKDGGKS